MNAHAELCCAACPISSPGHGSVNIYGAGKRSSLCSSTNEAAVVAHFAVVYDPLFPSACVFKAAFYYPLLHDVAFWKTKASLTPRPERHSIFFRNAEFTVGLSGRPVVRRAGTVWISAAAGCCCAGCVGCCCSHRPELYIMQLFSLPSCMQWEVRCYGPG